MPVDTISNNDHLVKKCEILSFEEQVALWKRYKENKDINALEKLIFCHLRLAYSIVDSFNNTQFREELKAEAYYAVIKAIEFWNPEKGHLTTIIFPIVRQAAAKYLQEECKTIRVPITAQNFYKEQINNKEKYDNLNKKQKIKLDKIEYIENIQRLTPKLIAQIEEGDILLIKKTDVKDRETINDILYRLTLLDSKSKYIVEHYFGLKEPKENLSEIARKLKIYKEDVKRNLLQALAKIRQMGICTWCGKRFVPNVRFKYHCSTKCKQLERSTKKARFVVCNYCRKVFIPTNKYKRYCCKQCKINARIKYRSQVFAN